MIRKTYFLMLYIYRWGYYKRKNCIIHYSSNIQANVRMNSCSIGRYNYIGSNTILNNTTIGNYCSIAPHVQIGGMEHPYSRYSTSTFLVKEYIHPKDTIIGNDVWIGAGCIIKQGVKIGDGAVVGANSLVTKDIEPYTIHFGNPAKYYKHRFSSQIINKLEKCRYWDHSPSKAKQIISEWFND